MVASSILISYENLRSLAFGGISAAYAAVGNPFSNPVRLIKVTNLTDVNLLISFNGIDTVDVVAANGFYLYDYGSNKSDAGGVLEQSIGKRIYVKEESAVVTSGTVYVTIIYASQV